MESLDDQHLGSLEAPADDILSKLECHFMWLKGRTDVTDYLVNHILEDIKDNPKILLRGSFFLFYLYVIGHYELQEVTEVQNLIQKNIDERNSEASNPEYVQGLQYIMKANKAHLLKRQHCSKEAENLVASLPSFSSLRNNSRAVIFACKTYALANCTHCDARLEAVGSARDTLWLDDENPEWHFSLAFSLGRKRREFQELRDKDTETIESCTREGEEAFLKAEKGGHEGAKSFRAELYMEKAVAVFHSSQIKKSKKLDYCKYMNTQSLALLEEIYGEFLNGEHKSLPVIKRLAMGFSKLPKPFKNLDYADKCFLHALERSPNCARTHEEYGYFLQRISQYRLENRNKILIDALKHLKLSWINTPTNIIGFSGYIYLQKQVKEDYDPSSDFYKVLQSESLKYRNRAYILCLYGDYLYNIDKKWDAIRNWKEALRLDPHGRKVKYILSKFTFTSGCKEKTTNFQEKLLDVLQKEVSCVSDPLEKAKKKMDVAWFHRKTKPSGAQENLQVLKEALSLIDGIVTNTEEMEKLENELHFQLGKALYKDYQFKEAHSNFNRVTSSSKNKDKVAKHLSFCNYQIAKQRTLAATSNEDKEAVLPRLRESIQYGCLDACLLLLQTTQGIYGSRGGKELYEGMALVQNVDEGFSLEEQKEVLKDKLKKNINDVLTFGLCPGHDTVGLVRMREKRIEMSKQVLTSDDKDAQSKLIVELLTEANFCLDRVYGQFNQKYYPQLHIGTTSKTPIYPRIRYDDHPFTDEESLKHYVRRLLQKHNCSFMCIDPPFEEKFPDLFSVIVKFLWKKDDQGKHLHKVWFQLVNFHKHRSIVLCQEDPDYYYSLAHEAADITEENMQEFWKAMKI